ncbi:MAG: hypothetical protein QXU32_02370 [Nitrososphaerales archaeon]
MREPNRNKYDLILENKLDVVRTLFALRQRAERRETLKYDIEPKIIKRHNEQLSKTGAVDEINADSISKFTETILKELL